MLRGAWMLRDSDMLHRRWVKIFPQIIDTLLLTFALIMVFWSKQYPFVQPWLTAKVLVLVVYIALGTVALKTGKTKAVRSCALVAALAAFTYTVMVALTKRPMIFA